MGDMLKSPLIAGVLCWKARLDLAGWKVKYYVLWEDVADVSDRFFQKPLKEFLGHVELRMSQTGATRHTATLPMTPGINPRRARHQKVCQALDGGDHLTCPGLHDIRSTSRRSMYDDTTPCNSSAGNDPEDPTFDIGGEAHFYPSYAAGRNKTSSNQSLWNMRDGQDMLDMSTNNGQQIDNVI